MTILLMLWGCAGGAPTDPPAATGDTGAAARVYEASWDGVQALIADECASCHPATNGIDLIADIDSYVVPGDPAASDLWEAVAGSSISTMMPPSGRLPEQSVAHVETWILDGAPQEER